MNTLVLFLLTTTLAVLCQGQEAPDCDLPRSATLTEMTRFVGNTTDIVRSTRGLKRIARGRKYRKSINEGRAASRINTSTWLVASPKWLNLCPARVTVIKPPKWFVFGGLVCYTPFPYNTFAYPTMVCRYRECLYVNRKLFYCRPDAQRVYTIPIYCFDPKTGRFRPRQYRIYTYRYCTCCRYGCPVFT